MVIHSSWLLIYLATGSKCWGQPFCGRDVPTHTQQSYEKGGGTSVHEFPTFRNLRPIPPPPPGLPQSGGEGNFGVTLLKSMSRASAAACMSFQGRAFALILRKMSMVVLYVAETPPYNIRKCRLAVLQLHTC